MSEKTTRAYELGYLLVPTAPETEVASLVDDLKASIEKIGGVVHSEGNPEFIDLAYTMEKSVASKKYKYSQGYFGWMKFEAAPEGVEALKKALDASVSLVRYILVKTDLQNMVVFKKPKIEAVRESSVESEELLDASNDDDLKEDHEMLPDVAGDIADTPAEAPAAEGEEKESQH